MATASTPPSLPDPLRLRRRLGLQGIGFGLLLLVAFASAVYWGIAGEWHQNRRAEARQLAATAATQLPLISHELQEVGNARKFRNDREVVSLGERRRQRVQWRDPGGRLLQEEGDLPLPAWPPSSPTALSAGEWQQWAGGIALLRPVHTRPRAGGAPQLAGYVRVGLTTAPLEQELARLRRGLLLGGITAVIVALMVGRRLLARAFRPLQQQVQALERFSADASHELRHPLTLLRTMVAAEPQPHGALLQRLDAIAAGMGELLNDLLFLARQEQRDGPAAPGEGWCRFDLLELLDDALARCAPLARREGRVLQLLPPPGDAELPVRGQPDQLLRLFTNLLLNAIRFSPPGGRVEVVALRQGGRLRLRVCDQGPGVPPEHRPLIFERFWSRGPGQHSGLGLPIARAIARRHGGELSLESAEPGRCVLLVDLPAA
ncbi:MAG: sensor histidine kinase [Cyanobium sp.]